MREFRSLGSVRGAARKGRPYREQLVPIDLTWVIGATWEIGLANRKIPWSAGGLNVYAPGKRAVVHFLSKSKHELVFLVHHR